MFADLYGMDEETLTYLAGLYGFDYTDPAQQAIALRQIYDLLRFIDRNGNPQEKEFFDALAVKDYVKAFSIEYSHLTAVTQGLLDMVVLDYFTNPTYENENIGQLEAFLQGMLFSEGNYETSSQSNYLIHALNALEDKAEFNGLLARKGLQ